MRTLRVVLVDDEPAAVASMQELLFHLAPDGIVAAVAANGLEAVRVIGQTQPDLVFLDVDLPLMNGLQVGEVLAGRGVQIIFTSGAANYAGPAAKLGAVAYLIKPIEPAEFAAAVEKARQRLR